MKDNSNLMTEGAIGKQLIFYAAPVFLGNLFQQLYNLVDSLIVGNFVGDEALAAVSSSGNLIFMFIGLVFGLFSGASVVTAKYFGAGRKDKIFESVHTVMALAMILGIILTIIGIAFSPVMLMGMDTPQNVLPNSITYFRIYFMGSIFLCLYNASSGVFQAVGDSRHPVYYLIASAVVNIVLDLLFVGEFHLGIGGAAMATVMSQAVSAVLSIRRLMLSEGDYQLHIRKIKIYRKVLGEILGMGIPSGIQNSVIGLANVVVQSNINQFGELAMAGCGSYAKIEGFGFLPITSFSMAITNFVSQNMGAGRKDRVRYGAKFGIVVSMICAELIGVMIFLGIPYFATAFSRNEDVIYICILQARTECFFYFILAASNAMAGVMRGCGKSTVPMLAMLIVWCVFRVAYITIALAYIKNIQVIFTAYPITWSITAIFFAYYISSGRLYKTSK